MILADHICSKSNFASFRNVRLKNKTSGTKICIRGRDAVVRKAAEHQVGGRSGVDVGWLERWESKSSGKVKTDVGVGLRTSVKAGQCGRCDFSHKNQHILCRNLKIIRYAVVCPP